MAKELSSINTVLVRLWNQLLTYLGLFFALFVVVLWITLTFDSQSKISGKILSGLTPQVKYWMQVGDQFQLSRTLSTLMDGGLFDSAVIFDGNGNKILNFPVEADYILKKPDKIKMTIHGLSPLLWRCETGGANDGWGSICLAIRATPLSSFWIVIFLSLGLALFLFYWSKKIREFSVSFTAPLIYLRDEIGRGSTQPADSNKFRFQEIDEIYTANTVMLEKLKLVELERRDSAKSMALAQLAHQVAHDIRSPLAALSVVQEQLSPLDENIRGLTKRSIARIKEIASHLLESNRPLTDKKTDEPYPCLLQTLIQEVIDEKHLQYRGRTNLRIALERGTQMASAFAITDPVEFKSVISNILNNAVEAIPQEGEVGVFLSVKDSSVVLSVKDNGHGIPNEVLSKLGRRGATYFKSGGVGLGLFHARTCIESWGGFLRIESTVGTGSSVHIELPKVDPPKWFLDRIFLPEGANVVTVDDDEILRALWSERFSGTNVKVYKIKTPGEFQEFMKTPHEETLFYLMDNEFAGFDIKGIDLIESLNLGPNSILVTNSFEDRVVQQRCETLAVRILPKFLAETTPIIMANGS